MRGDVEGGRDVRFWGLGFCDGGGGVGDEEGDPDYWRLELAWGCWRFSDVARFALEFRSLNVIRSGQHRGTYVKIRTYICELYLF